jgi:hypothetical protein
MRTFFLLRCNGSISPCLRYSDVSAGNLKLQSPDEIWDSEPAWQTRYLVKNCRGCSNSWATDWSFEAWFPSFLKIRTNLAVKKLLLKFNKQN